MAVQFRGGSRRTSHVDDSGCERLWVSFDRTLSEMQRGVGNYFQSADRGLNLFTQNIPHLRMLLFLNVLLCLVLHPGNKG